MVKVYQAQELTKFANRGWDGKLLNGLNSLLQGLDTVCADSVPQEIQLRHSELAFGGVYNDTVVTEALQYQSQVLFVLFR